MTAIPAHGLPPGIRNLVASPPGSSLGELALRAAAHLTGIQDDVARSQEAWQLLVFLQGRGDSTQRQLLSRALMVMERFPHYPRPRAEVARRALEALATA